MGAVSKRRGKGASPPPAPPPSNGPSPASTQREPSPRPGVSSPAVRRGAAAPRPAPSAVSDRSDGASSSYGGGGSVFADSSDEFDPRTPALTPDSSAPTTPFSSAPPTPYGSVREVLLRWSGERNAMHSSAKLSEPKVRAALTALGRGRHDAPWTQAYDALLVGLAEQGGAMAQAQLVASYLRQDAGERVAALHHATQAGAFVGREGEALAVASLLRKLKHDHATKQRLVAVQDALSAAAAAPTTGAGKASAAAVVRAPAAEEAEAALARMAVRKRTLTLPQAQPRDLACGTVSVLFTTDVKGGAGGTPLLLLGSTLDKGSFSKVKPVALLPAGLALVHGDVGPWVLRRTHDDVRNDVAKRNLRGEGYKATLATDRAAQDEEDRARDAAHSTLRPVLRMTDEAGNTYDLVRRMHGTTEQALSIDPQLREGPMLGRKVLAGVLAPLAALHESNRAHFDLKPENFFVDAERAEVVLGDFGLSDVLAPGKAFVRGTYRFEAPEMYAQAGRGLTPESDLYGLAYTLAVLLTPGRLLRSPLYLLPQASLPQRRPELVTQAVAELARLGLPNSQALRERAMTGLALREAGATYRAWYRERGPELEAARGPTPPAGWGDTGLDGLFAALLQRDPLVARLIARGLHPDVNVRGTAAAWQDALQAAPPVPQEEQEAWTERLARANRGNGLSLGANEAIAALEAIAEKLTRGAGTP